MIDDPLSLLMQGILLLAAGMYPLGFLFAACSPCCGREEGDPCQWAINFARCLRVAHVGTDPPVGGDCRLTPVGGIELVQAGPFQIHNLQSSIRIPVRLALSASGAARTPIGEVRTQVWRFNVLQPADLAPFDFVGPPWHLQVDVSVTGVATEQEAGVQSAIEQDEHGQPKLVMTVNQWTATITHDEQVTLEPAGVQRWTAGRLTSSSVAASLVSGGSVSGWSVNKQSGITIRERAAAVEVVKNAGICASGGSVTISDSLVLLEDSAVMAFLEEEVEIRVSTSGGQRDLRVTPDNSLCELSRDLVGIGVAVGAYPNEITATADEDLSALYAIRPPVCTSDVSVALRLNANACATGWNRGSPPGVSLSGVSASPQTFWSGLSLLWNLENGPFRTSHKPDGSSWTLSLDGEGDSLSPLLMSNYEPCPEGSIPPPSAHGVINDYCWDLQVSLLEPVTIYKWIIPTGGDWTICDLTDIDENFEPVQYFFNNNVSLNTVNAFQKPDGGIRYVYSASVFWSIMSQDRSFEAGAVVYAEYDYECPLSPPTPVLGYVIANENPTVRLQPSGVLAPEDWHSPAALEKVCRPEPEISPFTQVPGPPDFYFTPPSNFVRRKRKVCGPWTPSELPAGGGTVTRTCRITDGDVVASETNETTTVAARRGRLPEKILTGDATQSGCCQLLGLRSLSSQWSIFFGPFVLQPAVLLSPPATLSGTCHVYQPVFGSCSPSGSTCGVENTAPSQVPCDSCVVSVEVTAGEENATVTAPASGDKAGLVQVQILRNWLGGQGVTFTVSCGDDTITQVVRRADTAPEAPTNLNAVRAPCSTATLSWEAPHDGGQPITGYRVEYRPFNIGLYILSGTVPANSLSAVVTGLLRVGYQFRVAAINSVGTGAFSNIAVVDGFTLGAPTGLTFTRGPCDQVQLSWVAPTQTECVVVADYRLEYRAGTSGTFLVFGTVSGTATTGTVTGLDPSLRYQFRVARVADAGGDLFSNTVTSGAIADIPFGVLAALSTEIGEVDLTWSANELLCFENTDYLVQFRTSTISTWSDFARGASTDKFATVTGLAPATYFFRVRATNSIGNSGFSFQSNSVTIPEPE